MRILFLSIFFMLNLFAEQIMQVQNTAGITNSTQNVTIHSNFTDPNACKSCHREQMRLWQNSWHSNNNAQLYNKIVQIVAIERNELKAQTLIGCSSCHNPHLNLKKINNNYLYSKVFGLRNSKTEEIDEIIENSKKLSGISCYVCHKIDTIDNNESKTGTELIKWVKNKELFTGPYKNIKDTAHKNEHRSHFDGNNQICVVCHNGIPSKNKDGSLNYASAYNTGFEMIETDKKCIDCHMGEPYEITILDKNGKDQRFQTRPHLFNGAHDITKLREGFRFAYKDGVFSVKNTTPHVAPTGFGSRLLDVNITYFDKDDKVLENKIEEITSKYEKDGSPTFQYLADLLSFDSRLAPNEERLYELEFPPNAASARIVVHYHYIHPQLVEKYKIELPSDVIEPVELFNHYFKLK